MQIVSIRDNDAIGDNLLEMSFVFFFGGVGGGGAREK